MAPRGRPRKHVCNKCYKAFPSGRALGGHMSRHWRNVEQPKGTPSPPATVVDLHESLLSPSDEETLLRSSGIKCQLCSEVFSACDSLRKHMREHREKKVLSKSVEEAAGLMEALSIAGGGYNVLLSPPVKRKRSTRGAPALNFDDVDAAVTLLLLSEHSKKTSAYEDCYAEDMDSLPPNVSKDVKLNAFDHLLVRSPELKKPKDSKCSAYDSSYPQCDKDNNLIPNVAKDKTSIPSIPNNSACEDCFGQCEKDNSWISNVHKKDRNLIANVPEKDNTLISIVLEEVELNVLDHVLAGDAELRKPRTNNSVEMKCADLSAAVKVKRHRCNTCGKSFGSGQALGGHMRWHLPRCNDRRHRFADCPDSVVMKEQNLLELDTKFLDLRFPGLTDIAILSGLKSEPEPWRVASSVH